MADLTKLDAPALRAFVDEEVQPFKDDILRMRASSPDAQSLYDIAHTSPGPFAIGAMSGDGDTAGKDLVTHTTQAASAIDEVLNRHSNAFDDLKANLLETISSLLSTQKQTLEMVEGQKFLTALRDYDGAMTGQQGAGSAVSATATA
ncbi:type VII secretion system-associated protein [Streptomyces flaveolus]|uniref:type VII secretion system-associated protein n=1 Tax=Streptomyces flaveolus TaxID=67297 RepID=UPI0033BCF4D8